MGLFSRKEKTAERQTLDSGLAKTKESLFAKITRSIFNCRTAYTATNTYPPRSSTTYCAPR